MSNKDSTVLLEKMRDYLIAQGVGTSSEVFMQALPDRQENGIVVAHVGGISLAEDPTRRPSLQIQVRNVKAATGLQKAVEIHRLVDNTWNVLTGFPGRLTVASEAGAYFKDDGGRFIYTLNVVFVSTAQC